MTPHGRILTMFARFAICLLKPWYLYLGEEKEDETGEINTTEFIKKWGEENNLTHRTYDQHIYRLIRKIGGLTKHIEENDYNEAKQDLGYIYAALVILAKKLSGTGNEDYTSFLIDEIEAGHNIW